MASVARSAAERPFPSQLDLLRLAQLLAVPHAHLEAQRRGLLVIGPQLLPRRRRQQRPQLFAGAAEVHDEARLERVAKLAQDDALLVTAQLRTAPSGRAQRRGR